MNRAQRRRAAKAAGVKNLIMHTITIEGGAVSEAVSQGANPVDLVMYHVDAALTELIDQGGDPLAHSVVTIGRHPDRPGDLTIQAKTDRLAPVPETSDSGAS